MHHQKKVQDYKQDVLFNVNVRYDLPVLTGGYLHGVDFVEVDEAR